MAYHSGESGYDRYAAEWGENGEMEAFRHNPFKIITSADRPIYDTMAALVCHGVFARHPNLRVATIESGSEWAPLLVKKMKKSFAQAPNAFPGGDPGRGAARRTSGSRRTTRTISSALRDAIGAERILFGSDYPHAEGLADPASFVKDLDGFSADEVRLIMRENALALSRPRPADSTRRVGSAGSRRLSRAARAPGTRARSGSGPGSSASCP